MADIIRLRRSAHDETQLLLPWHLNGTLDADETALVQAHLGECADCRRDAEAERELFQQVATLSIDAERDWAAMSERLDAMPPRAAPIPFLRRRVSVGWLLAGQLATAAALALAIYTPVHQAPSSQTYQTLGSPGQDATGNVVIVFHPEKTEQDMRDALGRVGAQIVEGPNASGAYVLNVPPAQRRAAIDRLRAMPQVMLAEPIDPGGSP
jgi:hypothetical protein